jgi:hypothetical protein
MAGELLLVGSVPLDTPEQVMRMFGTPLGPFLDYLPDGEVGDRRWWVLRLSWQVFLGHPELELLKRPAPDNGVERLVPRDRSDAYAFRVRPGVEVVRFSDPGWRLGFTRDAVSSYFVFKTLKKEGVIPPRVRFQVSLPLVNSAITLLTFPTPVQRRQILPAAGKAKAGRCSSLSRSHPQHAELRERLKVARKYAPEFGLDAYCGFGRLPTTALPQVLEEHLEAVCGFRGRALQQPNATHDLPVRGVHARLASWRRWLV